MIPGKIRKYKGDIGRIQEKDKCRSKKAREVGNGGGKQF